MLEGRFSLVRCRGCQLVATFPPVPDAEIASYYPPSYYGRENRRFVALLERLIPAFRRRRARVIERFVSKGRILDVGCGRGILPALMRDLGWEAYGVEFSETLDVPRHYDHFGLSMLRRLLESNGFSVEPVSHFTMEQNPYGWIQSLLNAMGFPKNLLYDLLKNDTARTVARPLRTHPFQSALMFLALIAVIPLILALFLLDVLLRRGATIEVYARNEKGGGQEPHDSASATR